MSDKKFDLCAIVREEMLQYIRQLDPNRQNRLPSENQLAEKFQVSRSTIRTVLATLEDEGKVIRRHGSGTYVNQHAFELNTTLYPQVYFTDLIRLSGYTPSIELLGARLIKAGMTGGRLDVPPNRDIFEVRKIYRADGKMCIYCVDHLNPEHFSDQAGILKKLQTQPISIFRFLNKYTDKKVIWDVVRLETADTTTVPELGRLSDYPRPYLLIDSVNYDATDCPVLYAKSYVNTELIKYYLVRGRYNDENDDM